MSATDALLARLEAAVTRLEKLGKGKAAADDDNEISEEAAAAIADFDALVAGPLKDFVAAAGAFPDLEFIAKLSDAAFKNQANLAKAAAYSKKPSDQELLAFLQPAADAISGSENMNFKSAQYDHMQAFNNSISALSWPFSSPATGHIQGNIDAGDMYLNRVLVKCKDLSEEEKNKGRAFVSSFRALFKALYDAVKANFKAGVEWNPAGKPLAEYTGAPAAAAPKAAAPAPAAAAAPAKAAAPAAPAGKGALSAVFGQLSGGVTAGLKHVTADMKTKNRDPSEQTAIVSAPKAAPKAVKKNTIQPTGPPSTSHSGNTWSVTNYDGDNSVVVKDVAIRDGVYVSRSVNSTITVEGKAKSVSLDTCYRTTVILESALSSVEFVNCDTCKVFIKGTVPTVAIDKSKGIIVHLSPEMIASNPDIVTSNISECNVQYDGDESKGEDDVVELPLPEQYMSKFVGKTLKTEPASLFTS